MKYVAVKNVFTTLIAIWGCPMLCRVILDCFWPNLYVHASNCHSELLVKILTLLFDFLFLYGTDTLVMVSISGHIFTPHVQKLYFWASDQKSDIVIRFSDPDFLREIIWWLDHVFWCCHCTNKILPYFIFDLMTSNMCRMLCSALRWFLPSLNSVNLSVP